MEQQGSNNSEIVFSQQDMKALLKMTREKVIKDPTPEMWKAHQRAREIEQELSSTKPLPKPWMQHLGKLSPYAFRSDGLDYLSLCSGLLFLGIFPFCLFLMQELEQSSKTILLITGLVSLMSFSITLPLSLSRSINLNSDKPQKIRKFFAKLLLSKKQKKLMAQRADEWKMFLLARKSYDLLVASRRKELVDTGYLELISKSVESEFFNSKVALNDEGGFVWDNTTGNEAGTNKLDCDYLSITKSIMASLEDVERKPLKP